MKTIAIIGGGAAGLSAAICAARAARDAALATKREDVRVVIYEADERVGRSILVTGNGRCNFTNAVVDASLYRNADFVAEAFANLETSAKRQGQPCGYPNAVQAFFADLGLAWREEGEGRMYPSANKASSVLDVLRGAAACLGVEERCESEVLSVDPPAASGGKGSRFTMRMASGAFERADAVIVACGGKVARKMLPGTLSFAYPMATLGPLETDVGIAKQLDNIRVRGVARLLDGEKEIARETGEILFRKYGLSGIAIFNLSRFARMGHVIELDMLAFLDEGEGGATGAGASEGEGGATGAGASEGSVLAAAAPADSTSSYALLRYDRAFALAQEKPTCGAYLRGLVLPQVARVVLREAGFEEHDELDRRHAPELLRAFRQVRFTCEGLADLRQCQVHRGGFRPVDFDPRTMQARFVPGLYLAGEALDVDAPCGGYNLHWAWASGMLAGLSAADFACGNEAGAAANDAAPFASEFKNES